jgi:hypothetical protein
MLFVRQVVTEKTGMGKRAKDSPIPLITDGGLTAINQDD